MSDAAHLIDLGLIVVPAEAAKAPGVAGVNAKTAVGLTAAQYDNRCIDGFAERYSVVIGRTDIGLRSGVVDVETDGPEGERALIALLDGDTGDGPWMITRSGSIHRLYRLTVPEGQQVNFGAGLLPKVDVPWQFLAIDGDEREWFYLDLPIPEAPAALAARLLEPIPERPTVEPGTWDGDGMGTPAALEVLRVLCGKIADAPDGEWNNTLFASTRRVAEMVAAGSLDADHAEACIFGAMDDPHDPGAAATFASAWGKGLDRPVPPTEDVPSVTILGDVVGRPMTDDGNALRLMDRYAERLRYVNSWQDWLSWDGRRWVRGAGAAVEAAKETVRNGIIEEVQAEQDDDKRGKLLKWASASQSGGKLASMVALARSDPRAAIDVDGLDRKPWLLNCENGTLDLRTGRLLTHRPEDHLTHMCAAPFVPDEAAPRWTAFLERVLPTAEVRDYVRRVCGMALTGENPERVMFLFHGDGRNGKTVLAEAMMQLLGEYAGPIAKAALLERRSGQHTYDLAGARGRRLVVTSETEEGERLSVAEVKSITGGDVVTARQIYEKAVAFRPEFKVWLLTNYLPRVTDPGVATWDRLRVIPFSVRIPISEVTALSDLLAAFEREAAGILAWAVQGCLEWQRIGLAEPAVVSEAVRVWRDSEDTLGQFLRDATQDDVETAYIPSSALYRAYEAWCHENGSHALGMKRLSPLLQKRGLVKGRFDGARGYGGRSFTHDGARLAASLGTGRG